jgi:hypothetical protein
VLIGKPGAFFFFFFGFGFRVWSHVLAVMGVELVSFILVIKYPEN